MRFGIRVAADDEMEIIVGLPARCIEKRTQPHVSVFLGDPPGVRCGGDPRPVPDHRSIRRQRRDESADIGEVLDRRLGKDKLGGLARLAREIVADRCHGGAEWRDRGRRVLRVELVGSENSIGRAGRSDLCLDGSAALRCMCRLIHHRGLRGQSRPARALLT